MRMRNKIRERERKRERAMDQEQKRPDQQIRVGGEFFNSSPNK